jgi:hypothetical protein
LPLAADPVGVKLSASPPESEMLGDLLQVPQVYQRVQKWCWAACLQMVGNFYGAPAQQCEVVNKQFNSQFCCTTPDHPDCNQDLSVWKMSDAYKACGRSARMINTAVKFSYLVSEISSGRPVQVGLAWRGGGGHVALVSGTGSNTAGPLLYVNDPKYGPGWVYYVNLLAAYGRGTWQWTWVSIS